MHGKDGRFRVKGAFGTVVMMPKNVPIADLTEHGERFVAKVVAVVEEIHALQSNNPAPRFSESGQMGQARSTFRIEITR